MFFTIDRAGVAVAMVGFAGGIILFSALLENLVILRIYPHDPALFAGSLLLALLGVLGVGLSRHLSDWRKAARGVDEAQSGPRPSAEPPSGSRASALLSPPLLENGADGALASAPEEGKPGAEGRRAAGWGAAALGVLAVSVFFVGIKLCEKPAGDLAGLTFTWSFGVGLLASAPLALPIFAATHRRLPARADLGGRRDVLAGLASGVLWGGANACLDVAIDAGVDLGTANSVFQCAIVVSGAWGIRFGELEGRGPVALFFAASALFLGAIFLESRAATAS